MPTRLIRRSQLGSQRTNNNNKKEQLLENVVVVVVAGVVLVAPDQKFTYPFSRSIGRSVGWSGLMNELIRAVAAVSRVILFAVVGCFKCDVCIARSADRGRV